ncbi:aspartate/tyrosine/aromatic aminotransferase [Exilibacterium tricleocarpae]|uniref:Aminotransferase n=1 Tax=Exilibacterium tricleocarpae TaxID=2591008 RepID=A0A545U573_9GAMM|nr:amino acid aminotransferase [Exilibacterium tricleocarpae]TQV84618.1 aspartate/tyrosine/aromatic aminotransferase [Exilibacterium tricleocarpae]
MFEQLDVLPADPILGLMALHQQDPNPNKVDLGVGVYRDEQGRTPILASVKAAQQRHHEAEATKAYIGPAGTEGFVSATQTLLFGSEHAAVRDGRVVTVQTPGGCGALRVAAELIGRCNDAATIWVSDPTWANHVPLLGDAGITIREYPYYDRNTNSIRFDEMMATLERAEAGDLVLLHGCCHNPCGADLTPEQWQAVATLAVKRGLTPFIDIAYQGFARGLDEDADGIRVCADTVPELFVASSCSKNFGLYRERVGSVTLVASDTQQASAARSQLISVIRGIYSMPPSHGGAIVDIILNDVELRRQWTDELGAMRDRINELRRQLVESFNRKGAEGRFDFIARQQGMFSFLGIAPEQVQKIREASSIYMLSSSRINIAGLSRHNLDRVTGAVMSVL